MSAPAQAGGGLHLGLRDALLESRTPLNLPPGEIDALIERLGAPCETADEEHHRLQFSRLILRQPTAFMQLLHALDRGTLSAGALQSELHLAIWLYHGEEGSRQLFEIVKTILSAPSLTAPSIMSGAVRMLGLLPTIVTAGYSLMPSDNIVTNAVVSGLVELPWTAHLLPHILENLVDIPLAAQQSEAVRAKLSARTLDADGTALAKQLLHFCEQRGAEWAAPFRRALSKVAEADVSNMFCILDLALQRKHTLAHSLLDAFEEENRSGGVPELYRTDIVLLLLVARVEPFRIRAFACIFATIIRRISSDAALQSVLADALSSHIVEMHVPLLFDLAASALTAPVDLRVKSLAFASELLFQLFVGHASARADLLRLCFAAVAEESASERQRQFYIDVLRRFVQSPDALGRHIESAQEWLMLIVRAPWGIHPIFSLFLPLAAHYPSFYDFLVVLFRKLLLSRVTSERRTGLWGITQLLALHLRPVQGSLRPARDEHCKLIQMLKPAFAFPYALRLELYTTLTDILNNATVVALQADAANLLRDLILSRLLRFLTRPSEGAPQVNVLCCCEDTGSSLRLREPLAALLRLARTLVGDQIAPLLLDLLAQLCDSPATLLPMLPPTALPALAPLFSARLSPPYSLPPCEAVPECEVYKIPALLMMDLVAPLYLMCIEWQVTSPLHPSLGDGVTNRLLTVLANIKSACATGSKSPALPSEREDAFVTAAVAQWLLANADAVLQVQSAPLLFGAIQQGMAHASTRMQVAVAVQLLALNEKLFMLKEEDAEKRSLRVPLMDVLQSVLSPLLQHHADLLLPELLNNSAVRNALHEAGEMHAQRAKTPLGFDSLALALTDALTEDMWAGLPLSALLSTVTLISLAAAAHRSDVAKASLRLNVAAELMEKLLCQYCVKQVAPFRLMLRFVLQYHSSSAGVVESLLAHFSGAAAEASAILNMLPTTEGVALVAVLEYVAEAAKQGSLQAFQRACASVCALLQAPTELVMAHNVRARLCTALARVFSAGLALSREVSTEDDASKYLNSCTDISEAFSAWVSSENSEIPAAVLRRLPDLIYRMERLTAAANDVATRNKLQKIGTGDVALPVPAAVAVGRSRSKARRLRSRNAYVDMYLAEEDGGDTYADLEDWIVTDDQDE